MIKTHNYLYLVGNHLVLCRPFSAPRNFPIFLALDFPQLLDVLRNGLKFHIEREQGLKKLLNYLVTITSTLSFLQFKLIVLDRSLNTRLPPIAKHGKNTGIQTDSDYLIFIVIQNYLKKDDFC